MEHIPLYERPGGCHAGLCGSANVVDGPFDVWRSARSKRRG